jgi:hypothetical protein
MLDEMADAVLLSRFVPGTAPHPHPEGHRSDIRHPLGHEDQPVGIGMALNLVLNHLLFQHDSTLWLESQHSLA